MVMKIRKNVGRKKDLAQPDELTTKLRDAYTIIDDYKFLILGVIGSMIVLVLIVSGISSWGHYREQKAAEAMKTVFSVLAKPVEPPIEGQAAPVPGKEVTSYPTEEAKSKEVQSTITKLLEEGAGGAEDTAEVLSAAIGALGGKSPEALARLETFAAESDYASFQTLLNEDLGIAYAKSGKNDKAKEWFLKMKESSPAPYFKARALIHIGDLDNPLLGGKGTAAQARKSYEEALKLLPENKDEKDSRLDVGIFARQDVQMRLLLTPVS